jgi:transposase
MRIAVLGVDLGKNVCSLVGLNASGAVVLRRRAKRETVIALVAKLSPCIVGMEACRRPRIEVKRSRKPRRGQRTLFVHLTRLARPLYGR